MTVSRHAVDQMANFMKALSSSSATSTPDRLVEMNIDAHYTEPTTTTTMPIDYASSHDEIPTAPRSIDSSTQEMKLILERFHKAAGSAVQKVNDEAHYNRNLREALMTEQTPTGSRIGQWNIEVREVGKRKFYNVVGDETCIAEDLLLYEAALGLVRILNGGGRVNSQDAINLLRAEQDYSSALNDAVLYKHYLTKNPRGNRVGVFEARYSVAKHKAVAAREQVFEISERL